MRDAFLNSHSASERAEEFRTARLGRIIGGGSPVTVSSDKILCIHAIPHGALFGAITVDLQKTAASTGELRPIEAGGWGARFNIDGVISVAGANSGTNSSGYVQVFRNGIVEVVFSLVYFEPPPGMSASVGGIGATHVAKEVAGVLERIQRLFRTLEVPPPVSLFVSLHGVKGVRFQVSHGPSLYGNYAFDRETILLPEIQLSSYDGVLTSVLRPVLDALWQAAGLERCFDYPPDIG